MIIDLRTLSIVICITNFLLAVIVIVQYRLNKTFNGAGWWALGCIFIASGFFMTVFRDSVPVKEIALISGNLLLVIGQIFLYTGVSRFLHKKENFLIVYFIPAVFLILSIYFIYIKPDEFARITVFYITIVIIVFFISLNLFNNSIPCINYSMRFTASIFMVYGCFITVRVLNSIIKGHEVYIFEPLTMQVISFIFTLIATILWTFGFIFMFNQRLNAESREDKEHFDLIFDSIPDATIIIRLSDGIIININDIFTSLTGYTREDVLGRSTVDINLWLDPEDRRNIINELVHKGYCNNYEAMFRIKNGSTKCGIITSRVFFLRGVKYILSITHDITERRKLISSLRESEEYLSAVLDSVSDAIFVHDADTGEIIDVNNRMCEMYGYSYDEAKKLSVGELSLGIPPYTQARALDLINKAKLAGAQAFEWQARRKNGTIFSTEVSIRSVVIGGKEYCVVSVHDITERINAEEAFRESERQLSDIIQFFPDPVLAIDKEGRVTAWNSAMESLTGVAAESMLGKGDYEYSIPFYGERRPLLIDLALQVNKKIENEYTGFERDGHMIRGEAYMPNLRGGQAYLYGTASALYNSSGELIGAIESIRDISERKNTEDELIRIKKAFEVASNAIWITDHRAEMVVYCNTSFKQLFKYSGEELNKTGGSLALYADPAAAKAVFNKVRNQGSYTSEVILKTKDGQALFINLYADVVKDESGKPVAYMGIATDITEKKLIEAELIASRQRLSDIIQFFPDPVVAIDKEGRVTAWNSAMENLTGIATENMLGKGDYEYSIPFYGERKPMLINFALDVNEDAESKYPGFKRNGKLITAEAYMPNLRGGQAYLYGTAAGLYNPDGKITGAIESIRDISERKKTEEELTRIKKAIEVASNAIWLTDRKGESIIYYNHSFTQLFGYTGEEINAAGGSAKLYVHPGTAINVYNSLKNGRSWSDEAVMKTGDNRNLYISLYADVVKDETGNSIAFIGIATDVTEKKLIESQLIESRQRMADIIQFFPDAVIVIDNDGKVVAWNRAIEEMTGVAAEDMIGKNNYEYSIPFYGKRMPILVDLVLKSEKESESRYREFERAGKKVNAEVFIPELRGKPVYLTGVAIALYNSSGEIVGAIESIRDVTERKKTEQLLVMEKERLSITLRSIGDAVIVTDESGNVVLINKVAENLIGWNQNEIIGMPLMDYFYIIDAGTRVRQKNLIQKVIESGCIIELSSKTILINKNGTERVIADTAAPIKDKDNRIIGVIIVFRDITEKQKMEEELLKTQKLESIGIIAGGIAHDFNNILTGIIGYISLIRKLVNPEDRIYAMLSQIEKASSRATNLTQQLLTFSKGWAPIRKTVLINELLKESAAFVLTGSNIRCNFNIREDLRPVEIDEGQISQVINNLIINARQAMPEGGTIEISAENSDVDYRRNIPIKEGRYVLISVRDQGIGIPEENQSRIFDPFFSTKDTGNGLGLSTSYSIIKKHDGYITLQSSPGKGTVFYIYLPASKKISGLSEGDTVLKSYELNGRVLLMDDEEIIRKTATDMLKFIGLDADSAGEGNEAIEMFISAAESGKPYDLVIMDLTIPGGLGGKDAVRKFREINPLAKIIVSSGYSNDPIMSDFRRYGFNGIIVKPYKIDDLYDELKKNFM